MSRPNAVLPHQRNEVSIGHVVSLLDPDLHGPYLDEPGGVEVTVERQRLADSAPPHHGEARGINKGILALPSRSKPAPSFGFGGLIDVNNLYILECP